MEPERPTGAIEAAYAAHYHAQMGKRRRGAELQRKCDETIAAFKRVPAHLCMGCQLPRPFITVDMILADLQTELETGVLTTQGRLEMRLCLHCYQRLLADHARTGVRPRWVD
jgi:hypothetical protein